MQCFGATKSFLSSFPNEAVLWSPPEISGWLEKQDDPPKAGWKKKFLVLKGHYLFFFKNARAASPQGVVPLEYAVVDGLQEPKDLERVRHVIKMTLHRAYEPYCKQQTYSFATMNPEVQATWSLALKYACIPRQDLLTELKNSGRLQTILECADQCAQARKSKVSFFKPDGFRQSVLMAEDDQYGNRDLIPAADPHPLNMDPMDAQTCFLSDPQVSVGGRRQSTCPQFQGNDLQSMLERRTSQDPSPPAEPSILSGVYSERPQTPNSRQSIHAGMVSNLEGQGHGRTSFSFHPPQVQSVQTYSPAETDVHIPPQTVTRDSHHASSTCQLQNQSAGRASFMQPTDVGGARDSIAEAEHDPRGLADNYDFNSRDDSWQVHPAHHSSASIQETNWDVVNNVSDPRMSLADYQEQNHAVLVESSVLQPIQEMENSRVSGPSASAHYSVDGFPFLDQASLSQAHDERGPMLEHGILKISTDASSDPLHGARQKAKSFAGWSTQTSPQLQKNFLPPRPNRDFNPSTQMTINKMQPSSPAISDLPNPERSPHKTQSLDNPTPKQVIQQRTLIPWNSVPVEAAHRELHETFGPRPSYGQVHIQTDQRRPSALPAHLPPASSRAQHRSTSILVPPEDPWPQMDNAQPSRRNMSVQYSPDIFLQDPGRRSQTLDHSPISSWDYVDPYPHSANTTFKRTSVMVQQAVKPQNSSRQKDLGDLSFEDELRSRLASRRARIESMLARGN